MNRHSHQAADVTEVGTEAVAVASQQQAPAQIGHQWQVEKQHLKGRVKKNKDNEEAKGSG